MATATSELDGTSETATYGPPYNNASHSDDTQRTGVSWQELAGVRMPINAAQAFVLGPLEKVAPTDGVLAAALRRYRAAPRQR
jgi:hypothetical protein